MLSEVPTLERLTENVRRLLARSLYNNTDVDTVGDGPAQALKMGLTTSSKLTIRVEGTGTGGLIEELKRKVERYEGKEAGRGDG